MPCCSVAAPHRVNISSAHIGKIHRVDVSTRYSLAPWDGRCPGNWLGMLQSAPTRFGRGLACKRARRSGTEGPLGWLARPPERNSCSNTLGSLPPCRVRPSTKRRASNSPRHGRPSGRPRHQHHHAPEASSRADPQAWRRSTVGQRVDTPGIPVNPRWALGVAPDSDAFAGAAGGLAGWLHGAPTRPARVARNTGTPARAGGNRRALADSDAPDTVRHAPTTPTPVCRAARRP